MAAAPSDADLYEREGNDAHRVAIKSWTPLFCEGSFATQPAALKYYINYATFDNLTVPDYSSPTPFDIPGGTTSTTYMWIVFKVPVDGDSATNEAAANAFYDKIQITKGATTGKLRAFSEVKAFIYKGEKWGNFSTGEDGDFDVNVPWFNNAPGDNLRGASGAWDGGGAGKIVYHPSVRSPWAAELAYFLIGLESATSLRLKIL